MPAKLKIPIDVTLFGNVIDVMPLAFSNSSSPTNVTVLGIMTEVTDVLLKNTPLLPPEGPSIAVTV